MLLVLGTLRLAYKCRNVFSEFNESHAILAYTCLVGIGAGALLPVEYIGDSASLRPRFIGVCAGVVALTLILALVLCAARHVAACYPAPRR